MVSMCGRPWIRRPTSRKAPAPSAHMCFRRSIKRCAGTPISPDVARRARELTTAALGLAFAMLGCGASAATEPLAPGGYHVLFIGNSLTYTNDLPGSVAAIAAMAGDTIRTRTIAGPDMALIDHVSGAS